MTESLFSPLSSRAIDLAGQSGVYLGTSSWKYEGWQGLVYTDDYPTKKIFRQTCLREYASHFPTVGVDSTFYKFPDSQLIDQLDSLTPPSFRFGLKVTEEITVVQWPTHPRYGQRKGADNPHFLDGDMFVRQFLEPVRKLGDKLGPVMFEFGTLPKAMIDDDTFLKRLDGFLAGLPGGVRYGVEIRNRQLFGQDYFEVLRSHGAAHIHTSWSWMPTLAEQIERIGSFTANHFIMRLLTPPQVAYRDAVDAFSPYQILQKPLPEIRATLIEHLKKALNAGTPGYIFVNNRLEGAAPLTIEQIIEQVLGPGP